MSVPQASSISTRWTVLAGTRFILASVVLVGHMSLFDPAGHWWTRFGTFLNQGSAVYGFLIISDTLSRLVSKDQSEVTSYGVSGEFSDLHRVLGACDHC